MSIEDDDDLNFDDFEKKDNTLGTAWRDNPMVKVGIIVGVAVVIIMVVLFFGGEKTTTSESYVGGAPEMTSAPGTTEATPGYIEAVEEINERAVEDAIREGSSALPVPIDPPVGVLSVTEDEGNEEDPLQRWRRLQEERLQREIQQRQAAAAPVQDEAAGAERAEAIAALADTFISQMGSILESQTVPRTQSRTLTNPTYLEQLYAEQEAENAIETDTISAEDVSELLFPAGEVVYAQTLTESNTDSPGPVLAEIMSGPLKGNRILGTFQEQEDLLTLTFDTIVIDGESISIDAVALDPNTTLPGMATEVDHRYFKRIVLPAAAAFVEGMAEAIAESGRTTVTVTGTSGEVTTEDSGDTSNDQEVATGIQEAGEKLTEILDEIANDTRVMVKIHAGTPIGILFLEPVIRQSEVAEQQNSSLIPDIFLEEAPE